MANVSLQGSLRTCKVDTAWANKLQSDRFLNSNSMLCPPWNGVDTTGRPVNPDSFYTKTAGCNSSSDRVDIENALRPQYIEYVTLSAAGIQGGLDCVADTAMQAKQAAACQANSVHLGNMQTGHYGLQNNLNHNLRGNCSACRVSNDGSGTISQFMRATQNQNVGNKVASNRRYM